jgi:hypothetical protein
MSSATFSGSLRPVVYKIGNGPESQKVHALVKVRDLGLGLVEDQSPGRQPAGQPCLDLLGLLTGVAQREKIVGLCRLPGYAAWPVLLLVRPVSGVVHAA